METNPFLQKIFYHEDGTPQNVSYVIGQLKTKPITFPHWEFLRKDYDPEFHEIITSRERRPKDKRRGDVLEKYARVVYPAEQNTVRRMVQMCFTIPVKRYYTSENPDIANEVQRVVERVYERNRIDGENMNRFKAYFASCEMATVWYVVRQDNEDYGFYSPYKLKCRSYSPMQSEYSRIIQSSLYPLFDPDGDLVAFSFEYTTIIMGVKETKFETFTADNHYRWKLGLDGDFVDDIVPEPLAIHKIPAIYIQRPEPIFHGVQNNRDEIEFTLSRLSDIIRKNSAPIMAINGTLAQGEKEDFSPQRDTTREVFQFEGGSNGGISLISPTISPENVNYYIGQLQKNIEEETQLPNLSLENTRGLGALTGEARKTLLTDAHMKVGEEAHEITAFLDRECRIITAYLSLMNRELAEKIRQTTITHEVQPYVMNDADAAVKLAQTASNGKQFASRKTLIEIAGLTDNIQAEEDAIRQEEEEQSSYGL